MDLTYLYKALLRNKWIILFSAFFGALAGLAFTFTQKKTYLSNAQYSTGLTQTQKISLNHSEGNDYMQIESKFNNILTIFKSQNVMGMLSYEVLLHDLESTRPFRILSEKQKKDSAYKSMKIETVKRILKDKLNSMTLLTTYDPEEKRVSDLIGLYGYDGYDISKKLSIERVSQTDFLSVSYSSDNPELSAFIVNVIGLKFKEFYDLLTTTRTQESLSKLDNLAAVKRREVDSLKSRYENFRAKIGTPNIGDAATAAMAGVQELTSSLTSEQTKLNNLNAQLQSVNDQLSVLNATPASVIKVENHNEEIFALREKNKQLAAQLAEKTGGDPDIENRIAENTKKISQLSLISGTTGSSNAQRITDRKEELQTQRLKLIADISASEKNVLLLSEKVDYFSKAAHSGGGNEALANAYQADLNAAQKELDKYNNSIFASQDIDVSPDLNFKKIIVGQPATVPESRKRSLTVAIAGISMFILSIILIVVFEFLDTSLRTPAFFLNATKLKLLTTINKIDLQKKELKDYFEIESEQVREASSNFFIENMRKLRYELEICGKKVILITSLRSKEGKTVILESLANTLSMGKKKVLIIDANFTDNALTRTFNAKPMLETFSLNPQDNAIDKIWGVTSLTNISNTDIIGCSEGNYTPSEILPKNNLFLNIHKIAQHYDFILIEAAAINNHSDSKELSKLVEGIVMVFSSKNSLHELDRESIQFLKTGTGNKFIGAVLNNVRDEFLEI